MNLYRAESEPMNLFLKRRHTPAGIALGGCVALFVLSGCGATGSAEDGSGEEEAEAVPVVVAPVRAETLRETARGVGTLQAAETVEIRPEMSGRVSRVHFDEGSRVEEGALLYTLDERKLRRQLASREATVAAAEARLTNARIQYEQTQTLREQNVASREELERVRANFEAARAEVEGAKAEIGVVEEQIQDAHLLAPFTGMISDSAVDPGAYVEAGELLTTMYRTSEMEIAFRLPERLMGRVRPGQPVEVMVSAYPNRTFDSEVYFVSPEVDESTRDFLVKATVDNSEGLLRPGAFGTAVVTVETLEEQPVVPEEALIATQDGYLAFAVVDGVAQRRVVRIAVRTPGFVGISEGLRLGELVVREGHMDIADGDEVRITNEDALREADPAGRDEPRQEQDRAPSEPPAPAGGGASGSDESQRNTRQTQPESTGGTPS